MKQNEFPIDAVYLWCDGDDPTFITSRIKREAEYNGEEAIVPDMAAYLDPQLRYANHDELKYSLRSLEKHAPWINHIYIVTNKQRPVWLNDNPKVTVVDHSEIIPANLLPTFNACTIEQYIVNIEGLSEHFIFLNDDLFFNKDTPREVFFINEKHTFSFESNKYFNDEEFLMYDNRERK